MGQADGSTRKTAAVWTEEEARRVLAAWKASRKSGAAYARSIGISPKRLFWWRRRLEAAQTPRFIPVVAKAPVVVARGPAVVVTMPDAVRIEIADVDEATATWLVAVLRGGRQP